MEIRPYAPKDLEACRELWRALTQHHRDLYEDQSIGGANPDERFDDHLEDPRLAGVWVADVGGDVVGLTGLFVLNDAEGEVEPVIVRPSHRGQRIGRALLEHVIAEATRRGLKNLSIRPVARNAEAIGHFHAAGFTLLGHVEMFMKLRPSIAEWRPGITLHGQQFRY